MVSHGSAFQRICSPNSIMFTHMPDDGAIRGTAIMSVYNQMQQSITAARSPGPGHPVPVIQPDRHPATFKMPGQPGVIHTPQHFRNLEYSGIEKLRPDHHAAKAAQQIDIAAGNKRVRLVQRQSRGTQQPIGECLGSAARAGQPALRTGGCRDVRNLLADRNQSGIGSDAAISLEPCMPIRGEQHVIVTKQNVDRLPPQIGYRRQQLAGRTEVVISANDPHPRRHLWHAPIPVREAPIPPGNIYPDFIRRQALALQRLQRGRQSRKARWDRAQRYDRGVGTSSFWGGHQTITPARSAPCFPASAAPAGRHSPRPRLRSGRAARGFREPRRGRRSR